MPNLLDIKPATNLVDDIMRSRPSRLIYQQRSIQIIKLSNHLYVCSSAFRRQKPPQRLTPPSTPRRLPPFSPASKLCESPRSLAAAPKAACQEFALPPRLDVPLHRIA